MMGSEPSLPEAPRISGDDQESGLWLLHGQTPAQGETAPPAPPASRSKGIAYFLGFAVRGAKRLASPDMLWLGLVLIGLAAWAAVIFLPDEEPWPKNTPVAASPPVPSPAAASPVGAQPPAMATTAQSGQAPTPPAPSPVAASPAGPQLPAAATTAELDQAPTPPPWIVQPMEQPTGPRTLKPRVSHRRRLVRRVHGSLVQRWAWEPPCRYNCDNWTVPMTWHGGGY